MPAKPENEYVLLVVNKIGPGVAPADAAAIYGVTIPKATPAGKRRDAAMAKVRRAVEKWLGLTSEGQAAWAAANWKFDWGHVARYVHEDWLRSQGVMPYKPGSDLTWISDVLVATVLVNETFDCTDVAD